MFKFLTTNKKGFTLVELMIVMVLLGLGTFALMSLFSTGYRTFNKSEERYRKQELVKDVTTYLSKKVHVSSATTVEVFDDLSVLPEEGDGLSEYCYLYTNPEDGLLYVRNAGAEEATAISKEPLLISFKAYKGYEDAVGNVSETPKTGSTMQYQCMVTCYIGAVEDYVTDYANVISDDVYYQLTVPYHFPNMVEDGVNRVNTFNDIINEDTSDTGILVRFRGDDSVYFEGSETSINSVKYCFVATASYGGDSAEVGLLCQFRDECLLTNAPGREFVRLYYKYSPAVADVIAENETLRAAVRLSLKPLVVIAEYALNPSLLQSASIPAFVFMGALVSLLIYRKRTFKKRSKT